VDLAFTPAGVQWVAVSPRLRDLRRLLLVAWVVPITIGAAILLGVLLQVWVGVLAALAGLVSIGWGWVVIDRNYRSWRYAESVDDLLVTRGVLFKQLVVVPYGRMQLVDVNAGPLDRRFGIAKVQLHTAAATSDASIPGLVPEEAARLRDQLTALGEARSAGL
jgi:membrane protein YdbS with pleckstrin-like domain